MTGHFAPVPALVTVHLWTVPPAAVPAAMARLPLDRGPLRRTPGLRFARLLGTAEGATFTPRGTTLRRWALVASWDSTEAVRDFETGPVARGWTRRATEGWRVDLRPLSARGRWSGQTPFGSPTPGQHDGPVAALTRARLRPRHLRTFWRAVPAVAADLWDGHTTQAPLFALGIGEAPIGWQGTFSLWRSAAALTDFAHRRATHAAAIRRTAEVGWYAEELFARFAVLGSAGTVNGTEPLSDA